MSDRRRDLGHALRALIAFKRANPRDLPEYDSYLLELACMASDRFSEEECTDFASTHMQHYHAYEKAVYAVKRVLDRYYTARGRCLVEQGAKVEDPNVCTGEPSGGLFIIGRRTQIFVSPPSPRSAGPRLAIKAGTVCGVEVGSYNVTWRDIDEMHWFRENYITNYGVSGMFFITGSCDLRDLPKLAERAEEFDYERVYEKCSEGWEEVERTSGEGAASKMVRACLRKAAMEFFGSA